MRINIHEVAEVQLEKTNSLPSCYTRTLIIRDANGNKYEITLFAEDAEKLNVKA